MKESIFSTVIYYLGNVQRGCRSVIGTAFTVFPYLFGMGNHMKEVTEQYPDPVSSRTEDDLPPKTRGLLFNDINRCTGCQMCEKICPVQCIKVEVETMPDVTKKWVGVFDIDFGKCIFCGLCVESCQPASLVHTKKYERAVFDVGELVVSFGRGRVSPELKKKWSSMRAGEDFSGELGL